jgi:hypothetical protein
LVTVPVEGLDYTLPINGAFKRITNIFGVQQDNTTIARSLDWVDQAQAREDFASIVTQKGLVYTIGNTIYLSGITTPTPIYLVGYQLLPDYDALVQEDFFTQYAADFLKLFALKQLQMFVKEDARYYITKATMEDELAALEPWNSNIEISKNSLMLD